MPKFTNSKTPSNLYNLVEILVPRDKFIPIEGAKDFVLPKHQSSNHGQNSTGSAVNNANNRMQINSQQNNINQNYKQQHQSLIALQQQQQQQKQLSLLSRLVQKSPLLKGPAIVTSSSASTASGEHQMPIISSVRHINERDLNDDQRLIKQ